MVDTDNTGHVVRRPPDAGQRHGYKLPTGELKNIYILAPVDIIVLKFLNKQLITAKITK